MTSGKKRPLPRTGKPHGRQAAEQKPFWGRLRSQHVGFGVAGAVMLACCGYAAFSEDRQCVDRNNTVIDDYECSSGHSGARWYYGGSSRGYGSKATGGSYERGGFGGHFFGGG